MPCTRYCSCSRVQPKSLGFPGAGTAVLGHSTLQSSTQVPCQHLGDSGHSGATIPPTHTHKHTLP